jgi:hypothetical protein
VWQLRTIAAKRRVFVVLGPSRETANGSHHHPVLVLMSDNRPDTVGKQGSAIEPLFDIQDPHQLNPSPWEHETGMRRIT